MVTDRMIVAYRETAAQKQRQLQQERVCRQQRGWEIAQQAARLLQEVFEARKVVLFGSLLSQQRLHRHSDIDLAVWGLADNCYYQAIALLLDLDPELSIDLVQFESASPALRHSILATGVELDTTSTVPVSNPVLPSKFSAMNAYAPLIGQIRQDLTELETLVQQTTRLLEKILDTGDEDYLGTVALNLHSFYTGVERIFREIAQRIDGAIPEGADWHRRLLRQMSAEVPNLRPPVISTETRVALDEYCAFRHVVRNIYTLNLRLERVQHLATTLPQCYQLLKRDLETFCDTLLQI